MDHTNKDMILDYDEYQNDNFIDKEKADCAGMRI